jgi:N,N'-diacetyllegionaminate synthase
MITLPSGRKIGSGEKPFIIAEIGSNWRTFEDAKNSVSQAKAAGADAVKFQAFTYGALYGVPDVSNLEMDASLPLDWLPGLAQKAKAVGIEFMCTAFSPELVDVVDPYVNLHKVASAELSHVRILEKLAAKGKAVILSTGASAPMDIREALKFIGVNPVVVMYCVAAYPARDIDFRMLGALYKEFGQPVGYSDHTTDYGVISKLAAEHGACVIEKHMTIIPEADTPDRPHSLTVDEFRKMVLTLRGERPFAWGSGEENEMRLMHKRRLIVTKDVKRGDTLEEGKNFGIFRSLKRDDKGLSPFAIAQVHGRMATKSKHAGDAIGPKDFE